MIQTSEPWAAKALCAQVGGDVWYPDKGESTRDCKATCRRCPVTAECLSYALRTNEKWGVWGGKTERERRTLKPRGNQ